MFSPFRSKEHPEIDLFDPDRVVEAESDEAFCDEVDYALSDDEPG